MAEGWLRHYVNQLGLEAEVFSAGTEKTFVKPDAIKVMHEVGIEISSRESKAIDDLPDKWNFDVVLTVCDSANEACPVYPAQTTRLHVSFPDPSGQPLDRWREVRNAIGLMSQKLVKSLKEGSELTEEALKP